MTAQLRGPQALSSEQMNPLLANTFSLCLRDIVRSERTEADWAAFATQARLLDRIAGVNRSYTGNMLRDYTGSHSLIAASNLAGMVESLVEMPLDERNAFLDGLAAEMNAA